MSAAQHVTMTEVANRIIATQGESTQGEVTPGEGEDTPEAGAG
jgi:hypothetical protein